MSEAGTDNTVAIVAIAVSGGVALLVAIIGLFAAHYRQKRDLAAAAERQAESLAAEAERQKQSLAAEADRQWQLLSHERLLRDLEHSRDRVDEVIGAGEAALSGVCEARLAFNAGNQQACDDRLWEARNALGDYGNRERRALLQLGRSHDLIAPMADFRVAVQGLYDLVHGHVSQGTAVPVDDWNVKIARVGSAQLGLIDSGHAALGARLDDVAAASAQKAG